MKVDSREYQVRLGSRRFEDPSSIDALLASLDALDPQVQLRRPKPEIVRFDKCRLDTPSAAFQCREIVLRVRTFADYVACTYKTVSSDRYVAAAVDVGLARGAGRTKFEEGIYAFHSRFSRQTTTRLPLGTCFGTVADWARLFPHARTVERGSTALVASVRSSVERHRGYELDFDGCRVPLMLEIHRSPTGDIGKVELSWKHRHRRENFRAEHAARMRDFFRLIHTTDWVDLEVHLEKARRDSSWPPSGELGGRSLA